VNILVTVGESALSSQFTGIYLFLALSFTVLLVWELNRLVEHWLPITSMKPAQKIHPLIIKFIISLLLVVAASVISLILLQIILQQPIQVDYSQSKLLLAFGFRINLFLHCINAIVFFINRYKKAQLEAEELKKISVEAQFEALRNQVNPHFMFNCFNVLSTLVYKDADTSAKFIAQISNVYRYLLNSQTRKVVPLLEELAFIDSYLYLQQIRFGENLIIKNEITKAAIEGYVAPASLQMLIENAIKHNIVSKNNPLTIRLYKSGNNIVVSNNLQPKAVQEESTQRGLANIQNRYRLLSDDPVQIVKTESAFTVELPLLNVLI
jgi:sensor histidine kinase YesM